MQNGLRKWLVGFVTTILVIWITWVSTGLIEAKTTIAATVSAYEQIIKQLDRIENRLDKR